MCILLARFGRSITQAEWVKELKRASNIWLKERSRDYLEFAWQGGYANFSVSQSNLERVKRYIANQEEHHRKIGFQDELRALLRKHQVKWDEKYILGLIAGDERDARFAATPLGLISFRIITQGSSFLATLG